MRRFVQSRHRLRPAGAYSTASRQRGHVYQWGIWPTYNRGVCANEVATEVSPRNKTLYIKADDVPVWEEAELLAGRQSLSGIVTELLRGWVKERSRVVLEIDEHDRRGRRKVAFRGRRLTSVPGTPGTEWTVYLTAKGQFAIYDGTSLAVFKDIERLRANYPGRDVAARIVEALEREYVEEMDI